MQELCVDIFIPNDICLQGGKGFNSRCTDDRLSSLYRSENFSSIVSNTQTVDFRGNKIAGLTEERTETSSRATKKIFPTSSGISLVEQQDIKNTDCNVEITSKQPNSVQVVTGANFSGKSVYLKQIALIVYMAHVGR